MLTLTAGTFIGIPAFTAACRDGHLSLAGHQHLADDDMSDLVTSDRRAIECRTDGDGAEVDGRHRREST